MLEKLEKSFDVIRSGLIVEITFNLCFFLILFCASIQFADNEMRIDISHLLGVQYNQIINILLIKHLIKYSSYYFNVSIVLALIMLWARGYLLIESKWYDAQMAVLGRMAVSIGNFILVVQLLHYIKNQQNIFYIDNVKLYFVLFVIQLVFRLNIENKLIEILGKITID